MPGPYVQIANKLMNTAKPFEEIAKLGIDQNIWQSTPGGRIMNSLGHNRTFASLFTAFVQYGRQNDQWQWDPSIIGTHKGKLLDGDLDHQKGECALFAANLKLLADAPEPYGLGMNIRDTEYWAFYGKHKLGFVAEHDQTNMMSPFIANVRQDDLVQAPTRYYLWPNHKVVVHNGVVYDPSYGTTALKSTYLGVYQVKPQLRLRPPRPNREPEYESVRASVTIGEHSYVVAGDNDLTDYLFRQVPAEVRPEEPFQGPFQLEGEGVVPI